jgi:serine/threonine protein kinase
MDQTVAHYNILERLGGGALGDVYRARDTRVGRTIALMLAPPDLVADPGRRQQFLRDANAARTLNHPNIAMLFDVVEQSGRCYLAYEFAAGPSLRQEMSGRAMPIRRAIELAAQIADALAEGHARGFVHGDLRPETVVVTPKGSTKILNFGMASWTAGGSARVKASRSPKTLDADEAQVAGYLSPEQALGGSIDARSDVFSLGIVILEMLTGTNPFRAATPEQTVLNIIQTQPPAPSSKAGEVVPELDALISRMLAKEIDARPSSAAALAAEFRSLGAALDVRSGDAAPAVLIPADDERRGISVWIVVAVAVAGVAVWWFLR